MTNEEAIKFLKELYPNGGHCWLDEQRIEAIGMAVKALQEEPKKKCMYSNDNYTDEDRKVLCDGCEEECKYTRKEADWLQELQCKLDSMSKEDFERVWKKYETEAVSDDEIEKQFKAGDVVVYVSRQPAYSGLYLLGNPNDLSIGYSNANEPYQIALRNCTVASEDERKQFMRELESNGYKWNENTLRIEKVEPVSEDLEEACEQLAENARKHKAETSSPFFSPTDYKQGVMDGAKWQKAKDESTTEDLGEYINELSKQFPEVSFAKLSRIAVRVAKWQKEQDQSTIELAEDHAMLAGMEKMKEQMVGKAIDVEVKVDAGGYPYIPQIELYNYDKDVPLAKEGDKYKVVLIKEE